MSASGLRVVADLDLCQGHQLCLAEDPAVFAYDHDADHVVIALDPVGEEHRSAVSQAVKYCPAVALTLEETS
ncbi:ferredoxin [Nocardioides sp.]|uniref:ferredoxin n=1 Tax=Nocardioides sp. TaxID=35761 RepID=UPI002637D2A5|nr:ferredoxin [Nocardioides sp.]